MFQQFGGFQDLQILFERDKEDEDQNEGKKEGCSEGKGEK